MMTQHTVRPAAVAGMFYPGAEQELSATVGQLLNAANREPHAALSPKALIAPHAGYIYSGAVAAQAYQLLPQRAETIERVVMLGPAHRAYVDGMAFPSVDAFATPLGEVPLDRPSIAAALQLPETQVYDEAHTLEHCLEVQLPFLQMTLPHFTLVPFLVGQCSAAAVARVLEALWGGEETLIVVSSDLSHFLPYTEANVRDQNTTRKIESHDTHLVGEEACGAYAINGLMQCRAAQAMPVHTLSLCNSGDTAGDRSRVVGYGAYALA